MGTESQLICRLSEAGVAATDPEAGPVTHRIIVAATAAKVCCHNGVNRAEG